MKSVLVIEDNPVNMELVIQLLEDDYELFTAENGAVGVELFRTANPDLVLLDLSMPVMDGWQVLEHARTDRSWTDVPIIVVSAHAMATERDRALAAGASAYVSKPVDEDQLLAEIARLIQ